MLEEIGAKEWPRSLIFISSEKSCPWLQITFEGVVIACDTIYLPTVIWYCPWVFIWKEPSHSLYLVCSASMLWLFSQLPRMTPYFFVFSFGTSLNDFFCLQYRKHKTMIKKTQCWELIALKFLIVGDFYIVLAFQKSWYEITQLEKPQIKEFEDICVIFLPCAEVLSTTSIMEGWRNHSSVVKNFVFLLS